MSVTNKAGFTIIETMLFLAITGLLIASMLVGVGTSINVQRYRDSVMSLKSLLQDQYSQITSVNNSRDGSWSCDSAAQTSQTGTKEARGQSDCVILGRYITIADSEVTIVPVTGVQPSVSPVGNDITVLNSYNFGISSSGEQKSTLDWGTRIAWPVSGSGSRPTATTPRSIAILIVRSPDSGSVYTFTSNDISPTNDLKSMLVAGESTPGQGGRTICIDPNGLLITSKLAIFIHAFATNSSAIESRSNDIIQSLGSDTRC